MLLRMQREHFWYRGRHALLRRALRRELARAPVATGALSGIDMGGGCGGWLEYLHARDAGLFQELALADSSRRALSLAEPVVGSFAARYQVDLLDLPWHARWDVVFLLDVLEHVPDHVGVLRQVRESLRPGGLLVVTAPALRFFWTYNDEFAQHLRRYDRASLREAGQDAGLELVRSDYFMFLLSPALFLNRVLVRPPALATPGERLEYLAQTHAVPPRALNRLLSSVFSLEASLINRVRFPWGTSILAVFRRPPTPANIPRPGAVHARALLS